MVRMVFWAIVVLVISLGYVAIGCEGCLFLRAFIQSIRVCNSYLELVLHTCLDVSQVGFQVESKEISLTVFFQIYFEQLLSDV